MPHVIVWDIETVPDLAGFAAANGHDGKTEAEISAELGDKFPKHIYHSIICIGALIAHLKRYRDQVVAHHDQRRVGIKNYPTFDLALESAYFYYDFVVAELRKSGIDQQPKDLREYDAEFAAQCRDIAATAMGATRSLRSGYIERSIERTAHPRKAEILSLPTSSVGFSYRSR
jgi:hypothetical protein